MSLVRIWNDHVIKKFVSVSEWYEQPCLQISDTEMSSRWVLSHHCSHWSLSFWQPSMTPGMTKQSGWLPIYFSEITVIVNIRYNSDCVGPPHKSHIIKHPEHSSMESSSQWQLVINGCTRDCCTTNKSDVKRWNTPGCLNVLYVQWVETERVGTMKRSR